MRFSVFSLTLLLALTLNAAQYQKPYGQLKAEQNFKDYTVRIYRNEQAPPSNDNNPDHQDGMGCFEILRSGKQVHFQKGVIFGIRSGGDEFNTNSPVIMGQSILGDKEPNLVISEINGGNNSLCDYYIFQISDTFKLLTKIKDTGIGYGKFEDLHGDGNLDLMTYDELTFAYWNCCGADSPHPTLILRCQNHKYQLDLEKMKQPAPLEQELKKWAGEFKPMFASKEMRGDPNNKLQVPPPLWGKMLDLIYSGNMASAWKLCELSWPVNHPGKAEFMKEFIKQLQTSQYYKEINQASFQGEAIHKQ